MDVSVIIVNYNTGNITCDTIESIFAKTDSVQFEIIVVDNDSSDGSTEILNDRFKDRITMFTLRENLGFGKANNLGVQHASGRNILFLNPDTILLNNTLKILSDYIDSNPEAGMAGGNLLTADREPGYSFRRFLPSLFWEFNDLLANLPEKFLFGRNTYFNHTSKALKVGYISGADIMIRKDLLGRAGLFDPDYFLYFEETDLARRINALGYFAVSVPDAEIIHLEGSSFNSDSARLQNYLWSKEVYYKKWYNGFFRMLIHIIIRLTHISRILFFRMVNNPQKTEFWENQADTYIKVKKGMSDKRYKKMQLPK